jgi:hypothetical protein
MPGGAANAEIFLAQGAYTAGRHQEAINRARPFLQRTPPNQQALQITAASCFALKQDDCRRSALEQLVIHYPTKERWCDFIQITRNTRGLTDEQQVDVFRVRLAKDCMLNVEHYTEMGQLAIIARYPNDGKTALQKGVDAKALTPQPGDRVSRLITTVNTAVTEDMRRTPQLQAAANNDPSGTGDVAYGLHLLSYGKAAEAETAIQKGVTKGKAADPDAARIALGRAQLAQNKKAEAVRNFAAVPRASKHYSVARLWWMYAQQS